MNLGGVFPEAFRVESPERRGVTRAWSESGGNVSKTRKLPGASRPTTYEWLRQNDLET